MKTAAQRPLAGRHLYIESHKIGFQTAGLQVFQFHHWLDVLLLFLFLFLLLLSQLN